MTMWMCQVSIFLTITLSLPPIKSSCQFPGDWIGSWHHLGYDDPLNVTINSIDVKVSYSKSLNRPNCETNSYHVCIFPSQEVSFGKNLPLVLVLFFSESSITPSLT